MKQFMEILKKCPLFDNICENDLTNLLGCLGSKIIAFDKKYTIFHEGSRARYIGIVLSGSVHVVQDDYYGNRSILSNFQQSEVFAEAFACAEVESLPVNVIADEPCEIMLLDYSRLLHICDNACGFHRQLIFNLMKNLATKTLMFHQRIEITSKRTTREKLMAYLAIQAKKNNSNNFSIAFDRQELADYLEVDRSGLSAEISKLKKEKIIDNNKNHFIIL